MSSLTTGILSVKTINPEKEVATQAVTWKVVGIGVLFSAISLFFNNGIFLFICFVTLLLLANLTWRYRKPGILFFGFFMQWLQVISFIFWMNMKDFSVNH